MSQLELASFRIENYILKNSQTTWHYSCTTPMGAVGDPKAVCDWAAFVFVPACASQRSQIREYLDP